MKLKDFTLEDKLWEYNFEFECDDEKYATLDTLERYFTYKMLPERTVYEGTNQFIKKQFGFYPICDPDGSGEAFYPIIHEIYKCLWGWEKSEKTFGYIDNELFADCLFGGDTMNSVQTVFNSLAENLLDEQSKVGNANLPDKKGKISFNYILECWFSSNKFKNCLNEQEELKNYINAYHTLGNFVLVPKGFNTWRSCTFKDYWNRSLDYLKNEGYGEFKSNDFNKYVNYFFLWDNVETDYFVKPLSPKYNGDIDTIINFFTTAKYRIERRGKFMTAMLMLSQSDYQELQSSIFSKDETYQGFGDVISKIEEKISLDKTVKGILEGLKTEEVNSNDLRNE